MMCILSALSRYLSEDIGDLIYSTESTNLLPTDDQLVELVDSLCDLNFSSESKSDHDVRCLLLYESLFWLGFDEIVNFYRP